MVDVLQPAGSSVCKVVLYALSCAERSSFSPGGTLSVLRGPLQGRNAPEKPAMHIVGHNYSLAVKAVGVLGVVVTESL